MEREAKLSHDRNGGGLPDVKLDGTEGPTIKETGMARVADIHSTGENRLVTQHSP